MPNRSNRDFMQGTLRRFGQSIGVIDKDPQDPPPPPAPKAPAAPKP